MGVKNYLVTNSFDKNWDEFTKIKSIKNDEIAIVVNENEWCTQIVSTNVKDVKWIDKTRIKPKYNL